LVGRPIACGGFDGPSDQRGEQDRVLGIQAQVGDPDLNSRVALRETGVEIDHRGVQHGLGLDHVVDGVVIGLG
jgi:hypothetical protein